MTPLGQSGYSAGSLPLLGSPKQRPLLFSASQSQADREAMPLENIRR